MTFIIIELDLNSSNSKNNDNITYNEHIISNANWSPNYNDMESSNQMTQKFKMLQIKDKASNTPQKKKIIKFVPNTNYFDYNLDVDEFSTPINEVNVESFHKNQLVGKISSIKYKTNNIDAINKNNNEQHSNYTSNRSRNQINCFTEPEEYTRSVPYYSQSFHIMPQGTPPQKHVSRFDRGHFPLYGTSLGMKDFNNYAPHLLDPNTNMSGHKQINQVHPSNYTPNFPRIGNTGSFISRSTHYSSNKPNFCVPIEDEINFDNVDEYNTNEE